MEITVNNCKVVLCDMQSIISYKIKTYQEVVNLKEELKEKEEDLKKAETYLKFNCNHNWITDSIDSMEGYKEGIIIKYCTECELSD